MSEAIENLKAQVEASNPQADTDTSQNATDTSQEARTAPPTPDEWYSSLDETTKPLVDAYAGKLKTALDNERKQRKEYEKTIKELSAKAGKDNALSAELEQLRDKVTETSRQNAFYEAANSRDDLPRNRVAAAYKIAKLDNLIDDDGTVDWDTMKAAHDYLFVEVSKKVAGNAGNGAGTKPQPKVDMNGLMRRQVGR